MHFEGRQSSGLNPGLTTKQLQSTSQQADGSAREEAKTVLASAANIAKALSMAANSLVDCLTVIIRVISK